MSNQNIIEIFLKLIKIIEIETYSATDKKQITINKFRIASLKKALKIISSIKSKITNSDQIKDIKGIGKGTIDRVNEILTTGTLKEVANYDKIIKKSKSKEDIIEDLMKVIGIGRIMAINLIDMYKIKSAEKLKQLSDQGKIELNDKLKLGLKYLGKFEGSIPRKEIDKIYDHLQDITHQYDNSMFITICGSYRRGLTTMSDVDIMLTSLDIVTNDDLTDNILDKYVNHLHQIEFLIDDITDKNIKTKYMGFGRLNNKLPIRRVDIRLIPMISYFPALVYFTGSYYFNQEMRIQAKRLGYKLNEYGLYDNRTNEMIPILSEQDLFAILEMKYLSPNER